MTDESKFEREEIAKIRQLLGGISLLIINYDNLSQELLDRNTFALLYQDSGNKHILELTSYWFTDPNFKIVQREEVEFVHNLLASIIKRVVNKNAHHGVMLVRDNDALNIIYQER